MRLTDETSPGFAGVLADDRRRRRAGRLRRVVSRVLLIWRRPRHARVEAPSSRDDG